MHEFFRARLHDKILFVISNRDIIMVLVMDLLTDNIASVRLQAAHLAASITEHLIKGKPQNTEIANEFVENVSKNYKIFFIFISV